MPVVPEYDEHEKLNFEKTVTGLYMSGHPYESYQEKFQYYTNCTIGEIESWKSKNIKACFGGIITAISEKTTKNNDTMAIIALEDSENNIEVVAFSRTWTELKEKLKVGTVCVIEGLMGNREQIIVSNAKLPDELENTQEYCEIPYDWNKNQTENVSLKVFIQKLNAIKGKARVILVLQDDNETCKICLKNISIDPQKAAELF